MDLARGEGNSQGGRLEDIRVSLQCIAEQGVSSLTTVVSSGSA